MKNTLKTIPFLVLLTFSCKKDQTVEITSGYRIVSESYYFNDRHESDMVYTYTGNKLSSITTDPDHYSIKFNYPDKNSLSFEYSLSDGPGWIEEGTGSMKLNEGKVTEIIINYENESVKSTFNYNSDGKLITISWFCLDGTWKKCDEVEFGYVLGKLVQIQSKDGADTYKYSFSYKNDRIDYIIYSIQHNGNPWTDHSKEVYFYNMEELNKITEYRKSDNTWKEGGSESFTYDLNGNLISTIGDYGINNIYRFDYEYEKGSGNYKQIFSYFENRGPEVDWYYSIRPIPSKSLTLTKLYPLFRILYCIES